MVIPIILGTVSIIWVYLIGKSTGRKETKRKIHRVLQARDPLYSLGHLNQDLADIEEQEYLKKSPLRKRISDILKLFKEL